MKILSIILLLAATLPVAALGQKDNNSNDSGQNGAMMAMTASQPVPPPGVMDGKYVKPTQSELKKKLTDLQYKVTQEDGTEMAFHNTYWDNHRAGIYVDIVSGEPLFSSTDKFDSGTGWPSFTKPLEEGNVVTVTDDSLGLVRMEVRSYYGDSHLGHVFNDGPKPTGLRYCIDSASLRFIPVADLKKDGYGQYSSLFGDPTSMTEPGKTETAVLAGGCFWGMEGVFEKLKGVEDVVSGYSGGNADTAHYKMVGTGMTGHAESVQIKFDPSVISYHQILEVFFRVAHNPTELNYQGPDVGSQYRSAIFYSSEEQKKEAQKYITQLTKDKVFKDPIVTEITELKAFYPAEEYHQDFMKLHPDYPYIVYWDLPKIKHLESMFPRLVKEG